MTKKEGAGDDAKAQKHLDIIVAHYRTWREAAEAVGVRPSTMHNWRHRQTPSRWRARLAEVVAEMQGSKANG